VTTLFISDLHLEEGRPDITRAFLDFLENRARGIEHLYILGDFFEAWIGDDERTPLQEQVAEALRALVGGGTRLSLMHGNRDFLIGEDFCQRIGATLITEDEVVIDLYGTPTLLMHGDTLCTADVDYQKFRTNMRNTQWQHIFLKRPLADRQMVARQLREMSQAQTRGKQEGIMDVTPDEVVRVMEDYDVQQLIHGHTHRPAVHELEANGKPAKRIVLGDWGENVWWIRAEPNEEPQLLTEPFRKSA
jgi:UDP-2,3-diacylglucosamine hydrolase